MHPAGRFSEFFRRINDRQAIFPAAAVAVCVTLSILVVPKLKPPLVRLSQLDGIEAFVRTHETNMLCGEGNMFSFTVFNNPLMVVTPADTTPVVQFQNALRASNIPFENRGRSSQASQSEARGITAIAIGANEKTEFIDQTNHKAALAVIPVLLSELLLVVVASLPLLQIRRIFKSNTPKEQPAPAQ